MQIDLWFLCSELKSESDFVMEYPDAHVGIIVGILSATSNLNVITSPFRGGYPEILIAEALFFSAKAEREVVSIQ